MIFLDVEFSFSNFPLKVIINIVCDQSDRIYSRKSLKDLYLLCSDNVCIFNKQRVTILSPQDLIFAWIFSSATRKHHTKGNDKQTSHMLIIPSSYMLIETNRTYYLDFSMRLNQI